MTQLMNECGSCHGTGEALATVYRWDLGRMEPNQTVDCPTCRGRGSVPAEIIPEPANNAEELKLFHEGKPSAACFLSYCWHCDIQLGYIPHYVAFPSCSDCEEAMREEY